MQPRVGARRLTHLLILVDREPLEGASFFIYQLAQSLLSDGKPYSHFMDDSTKIALKIVPNQDFGDEALMAATLLAEWGHEVMGKMPLTQRFQGRGGNGATVEVWS